MEKTVTTRVIDLSDKSDPDSARVYRETWPVRRQAFKDNREGKFMLPEISFQDWLKVTADNPPMVFINGIFVHSYVFHQLNKAIDYEKFGTNIGDRVKKIFYFSANKTDPKLNGFFFYLQHLPKFSVIHREITGDFSKKEMPDAFKSVAVDMAVAALEEAYNDSDLDHVMIMSRDPDLIPLIRKLRELDIKVTLARAKTVPTTRYLLQEPNFIVDLNEILTNLDCVSETRHRKKNEVETTDDVSTDEVSAE